MDETELQSDPGGAGAAGANVQDLIVCVADFAQRWDCLERDDLELQKRQPSDEEIAKELNIDLAIAKELAIVCSPDTLNIESKDSKRIEDEKTIMDGIVPERGDQLHTVRARAGNYQKYGFTHQNSHNRWFQYNPPEDPDPTGGQLVLLTVSVAISCKSPLVNNKVKRDREVLVRADQPLTALKDMLVCPLDLVYLCGECSEIPDTADDTRAQDLFKSSFFFIENTFYSDMRNPAARDISQPAREWIKQGKSDYFSSDVRYARMEETHFSDLTVTLGMPYLYVHQGDCEHTITFTDIRFRHGDDCSDLAQYPVLVNQSMLHKVSCFGCKILTAKWMTREDSLTPTDPSYFCDVCFYKFHYDNRGNKLGTFSAYRHIDPSVFR